MEPLWEYSELNTNRETMYRFLGRIYKVEVDQELLEQMKGMCFPKECSEPELDQGYRLMERYLRRPGNDPLTDLAVDYAKVFLGAGINNGAAAYPYESVYTSAEKLIMQEARDQVLAEYRAKGLNAAQDLGFPEDHIAFELEFMAFLCQETNTAFAAADSRAVLACLKEEKRFLEHHLSNWVDRFCVDIEKSAETDFYKGMAKITRGYLHLEHSILDGWINEIMEETPPAESSSLTEK